MLGREQQAASGGTAGCKWRRSRLHVEKKQAASGEEASCIIGWSLMENDFYADERDNYGNNTKIKEIV